MEQRNKFRGPVERTLAFKPFTSKKQATDFLESLESEDAERIKRNFKYLNGAFSIANDLLFGKLEDNEMLKMRAKAADVSVQKFIDGTGLITTPHRVAEVFDATFNEGDLDSEWMRLFSMNDFRDSVFGQINDLRSLIEFKEYASGENIQFSAYKEENATKQESVRHGAGLLFDRKMMELYPQLYMNNVVTALRIKGEEYKATEAYANIQAAIDEADSNGQTTSFVTGDLPKTLNNAVVTLSERMHGKGYGITRNTPMVVMSNMANMSDIEKALTTVRGAGSDNTNIVHFPLIGAYTYNLDADFGLGGANVAVIVLPGKQNSYGVFDDMKIDQDEMPQKDGVGIYAQERYSFKSDSLQFQIVELA